MQRFGSNIKVLFDTFSFKKKYYSKWAVYYDDMFRGYAKYHQSDYSAVVEEHLPELRLAGLKRLLDRRFFDLEYVSHISAGEYWTIELFRPDSALEKQVQLNGFCRDLSYKGNYLESYRGHLQDPFDRAYMYFKVLTQEIINLHRFPWYGPKGSF